MFTKFIVNLYQNTGDGIWSSTPISLTDVRDVKVALALGSTKDTFSFKLSNYRNTNTWTVKPQDKLMIYESINGASGSDSNLLIVGLVKKVTEDMSDRGKTLSVEGVSFSEVATNALVFYDPGTRTEDVMTYLHGCLTSIELRNTAFNVSWDSSNPALKYNPATGTYTGSAFKTLTSSSAKIKEYDKALSATLDKYLKGDYTGDGDYFWYIIPDGTSTNYNKLVIRKKNVGNIKSTWFQGADFKTAKTAVNADDIKNFIIVKCGLDLNNRPITTRYDDVASRAKNGFKYYMLVDSTIAEKVKNNNPTFTNAQARAQAIIDGKAAGQAYALAHNKGYLQVMITTAPSVSYFIGDRIQLTIPSYADYTSTTRTKTLINYPMRIKDIQYSIDGNLYTLEEEAAL
jgi:hypothetical protein